MIGQPPPSLDNVKIALKETVTGADAIIESLVANLSNDRVTAFSAVALKNIFGALYQSGINIRPTQIQQLQHIATFAASRSLPIVFLPCHKSHVDYLVVSYVLYSVGIALPHIAAGENLNLWGIGSLLRSNGAFFIKRQFKNDKLYYAVVQAYLRYLLVNGHNIEFFIEGGRSRTGKLLPPKFGFLKFCLDVVLEKLVEDVLIVPVSIGYDKVIETSSYVNEMLGTPKEKESIAQLIKTGLGLLTVVYLYLA
jgi:glycerol-3-phosphate O-acyltransferase